MHVNNGIPAQPPGGALEQAHERIPQQGRSPRKVIKPFPPLEQVTSPTVDTDAAAYYLNRRPQTLRGWNHLGIGPLQPTAVIKRRLAWLVADIRRLLGITVEG